MQITALNRQSLFDIAIQALGGVDAAFSLALENDLSLTDELTTGKIIDLSLIHTTRGGIVNKVVVDYYKNKESKPATGITEEQSKFEGIEFMGIEIDFIVSPDNGLDYQKIEVELQVN